MTQITYPTLLVGSAQLLFYVALHFFISFSFVSSFHLHHFSTYILSFLHIFFVSFCHLFHPSFTFFCTSLTICIILICNPLDLYCPSLT